MEKSNGNVNEKLTGFDFMQFRKLLFNADSIIIIATVLYNFIRLWIQQILWIFMTAVLH